MFCDRASPPKEFASLDNSLDRERELLRDLIKKFPSKMAQAYGQN